MQRLGELFARLAQRWLPDPLVLACLLTILVLATAVVFPQTDALRETSVVDRSGQVVSGWLTSLWNPKFLVFALQMCMVLLTGFGLAKAPAALRGLRAMAGWARNGRSAVFLVGLTSCVGCWINWGFGLVLAGLLAREVRRNLASRRLPCNYALIVAAAYAGMMVWHGGFSGSAPLKFASEGVIAEAMGQSEAIEIAPMSIASTLLSPMNIVLSLVLFIAVPTALWAMSAIGAAGGSRISGEVPADDLENSAPPSDAASPSAAEPVSMADRLNRSRALSLTICACVVAALVMEIRSRGSASINLNFVNSTFLAMGLLLHRNILSYAAALAEGGRAIVGIVVQFPLYSGIQGVMFSAGLAASVSRMFVDASQQAAEWLHVSVESTFPVATFLSAGVVNFFVPSGGGQWIVQGPIMCGAAAALALPVEQTVMAISYGDQWTNMVQPFWAIPLMGMTQVNAREFMGYSALLMLLAGPLFVAALLLF